MNPFNLQIIYTTNYCNWNRRTFKGGKEKNRKILIIMKDGWRAGVRKPPGKTHAWERKNESR